MPAIPGVPPVACLPGPSGISGQSRAQWPSLEHLRTLHP